MSACTEKKRQQDHRKTCTIANIDVSCWLAELESKGKVKRAILQLRHNRETVFGACCMANSMANAIDIIFFFKKKHEAKQYESNVLNFG